MKTMIRSIEHTSFNEYGYKNYFIEILVKRYPDLDVLEPIGHIKFSTYKNRNESKPWYGITYVCETDKPENLKAMFKIAKVINENSYYDVQPSEVKAIIGAVEYGLHNSNFIPLTWEGMKFYKVYTRYPDSKESYHSHIYAPNDIIAERKFQITVNKNSIGDRNPRYELVDEYVKPQKLFTS